MKKFLLIVAGLFVAGVVGVVAIVGMAASEVDKALNAETANDTPSKVDEGATFTHDKWKVTGDWAVKPDALGAVKIAGMRVENVSDDTDTPMLTFRLSKGKQLMGEVECSANELQPGQTARMDCVSFDQKVRMGSWDTIKVSEMW